MIFVTSGGEPYGSLDCRAAVLFYFYSYLAGVGLFANFGEDSGFTGDFGGYFSFGVDSGDAFVFAAPFDLFGGSVDLQLLGVSLIQGDGPAADGNFCGGC